MAAITAQAADIHVQPVGQNYQPACMRAASLKTEEPLVLEDFSRFPAGTRQNPGEVVPIGNHESAYTEINPTLTQQSGWRGRSVYAVDGAAMIHSDDSQYMGVLRTPQGDYSGHVTLTMMVKPLQSDWHGNKPTGNSFYIMPIAYDEHQADTDIDDGYYSLRMYEKDGWVRVTAEFDNHTTDAEGCIMFYSNTDILIDDVQITTEPTFIGSPTMLQLTDPKEDGFTINWMPVRKAFNYYIHLFTLEGYADDGSPVYKRVCPPDYTQEVFDELQELVDMGELDEAYLNYSNVDVPLSPGSQPDSYSYTFTNLDPEKEYYYCVQSHLVSMFSSLDIKYHAMFVATPEQLAATDIHKDEGEYTANWSPVAKGDAYTVTNYGVYNMAQDNNDFALIEEDFSGMDALTDAQGMADMDKVGNGEDGAPILNEGTQLPGWSCSGLGYAKGMAGTWDSWDGYLQTPELWIANNSTVRVSLGFQGESIGIYFAGARYELTPNDSYTSCEVELPTNGYTSSPMRFYSGDGVSLFLLDYLVVSQDIPQGASVYVWQEDRELDANATSTTFTELDFAGYDNYAFQVTAHHTYGNESCVSTYQMPRMVDESQASTPSLSLNMQPELRQQAPVYYDLTGRKVENPSNGIFIKVQDGKSVKVCL